MAGGRSAASWPPSKQSHAGHQFSPPAGKRWGIQVKEDRGWRSDGETCYLTLHPSLGKTVEPPGKKGGRIRWRSISVDFRGGDINLCKLSHDLWDTWTPSQAHSPITRGSLPILPYCFPLIPHCSLSKQLHSLTCLKWQSPTGQSHSNLEKKCKLWCCSYPTWFPCPSRASEAKTHSRDQVLEVWCQVSAGLRGHLGHSPPLPRLQKILINLTLIDSNTNIFLWHLCKQTFLKN